MAERDEGRDRVRDRAGALGEAARRTSSPTCARRSRPARAGTTSDPGGHGRAQPGHGRLHPRRRRRALDRLLRLSLRPRTLALAGLGAALGAALWWRKNPSACPYGQRFWVEAPHPLITRERLREALRAAPGERVLEIGAGHRLLLARPRRVARPGGTLELFDLQQEMLDHTMRSASPSAASPTWPRPGATRRRSPSTTAASTRSCSPPCSARSPTRTRAARDRPRAATRRPAGRRRAVRRPALHLARARCGGAARRPACAGERNGRGRLLRAAGRLDFAHAHRRHRTSPSRPGVARGRVGRVEGGAHGRLRRVDCSSAGIRRVRRGRGFSYEEEDGTTIADREVLERIRELAIPPAWKEVWICPHPNGHIQATGYRRRRAQAVPLPPAVARGSRPREVRRDGAFARALPRDARAHRRGPRPPRAGPRAGPRLRGAPARPRLLPDRLRALHRGERDLRARDPAPAPRDDRRRRRELRLHGEGLEATTTRRSPTR